MFTNLGLLLDLGNYFLRVMQEENTAHCDYVLTVFLKELDLGKS